MKSCIFKGGGIPTVLYTYQSGPCPGPCSITYHTETHQGLELADSREMPPFVLTITAILSSNFCSVIVFSRRSWQHSFILGFGPFETIRKVGSSAKSSM